MSQADSTRERLIEIYRKKAKHYDFTSRLSPAPGYPQRALRLRAVRALGLRAGDRVVDIACGTGLNFPLVEEAIGPGGRIVGVDLTDAMLARAQARVEANGWNNVSLVHQLVDQRLADPDGSGSVARSVSQRIRGSHSWSFNSRFRVAVCRAVTKPSTGASASC